MLLRILSGSYKGCSLLGVSGLRTRPSSQRVRTQVFDVLCGGRITTPPDWSQTSVLDGFCGFGTLGLEALSRGARMVFFLLEKSFPCVQITRRNLAAFGRSDAWQGHSLRCFASSSGAGGCFVGFSGSAVWFRSGVRGFDFAAEV